MAFINSSWAEDFDREAADFYIKYKDKVDKPSKYDFRLVEEWKTHGKLIVAVDFDDTIYPFKTADKRECQELLDYLISIQDKLHIIIWTASDPNRYEFIESYCKEVELNIVGVNVPAIEGLKYGTENKPYFNLLIDDRAGKELAVKQLKYAHSIVYKK